MSVRKLLGMSFTSNRCSGSEPRNVGPSVIGRQGNYPEHSRYDLALDANQQLDLTASESLGPVATMSG
jgi:hypothetical protein